LECNGWLGTVDPLQKESQIRVTTSTIQGSSGGLRAAPSKLRRAQESSGELRRAQESSVMAQVQDKKWKLVSVFWTFNCFWEFNMDQAEWEWKWDEADGDLIDSF
jgi:hypothetical protein